MTMKNEKKRKEPLLISLHLPKTAGSSFGRTLEEHYAKRFFKDYVDFPINTPAHKRKANAIKKCIRNALRLSSDVSCIHGHFLPLKYALCGIRRDVRFVTWMRDPVERISSHYYFWKNNYNPDTAPSLHKRVVEEDWSFERFCLGPELRNLYRRFLWWFPLKRFDFIGIAEDYDSDFAFFAEKFFGRQLPVHHMNVNPDYNKRVYVSDDLLRARIEKYHRKDMELFHMVKKQRQTRID